jgi:hypothetical protein
MDAEIVIALFIILYCIPPFILFCIVVYSVALLVFSKKGKKEGALPENRK